MQSKLSLNYTLASVVLIIYFAELVFPPMRSIGFSAIICLTCLFMWFFLTYTIDTSFIKKNYNLKLLLIYISLIIAPAIMGYPIIAHRYANMGLVICGSVIYNFYYTHNKLNVMKKILIIVGLLSMITLFVTYRALLENQYISRSIKSNGEYSLLLARQGIGGYTFIYFVAIISILILYYFIEAKETWKKIGAVVGYVISVLFIIKSNYMTAFLIVIIGSCLFIFLKCSLKGRNGIITGILVVLFIVLLAFNMDKILLIIEPILPKRIGSILIAENSMSVSQSIFQEFVNDRFPTMTESIEVFKAQPLFGLIGSGRLQVSNDSLYGFGQHSYILDTFALYGIWGGILNLLAVIAPLKNRRLREQDIALNITMSVITLLLYFINNASESIALAVTIIYPFINDVVCAKRVE